MLFRSGPEILRNLHFCLYVSAVDKSKVEFLQNFVAFSKYTNFEIVPIHTLLIEAIVNCPYLFIFFFISLLCD